MSEGDAELLACSKRLARYRLGTPGADPALIVEARQIIRAWMAETADWCRANPDPRVTPEILAKFEEVRALWNAEESAFFGES